MFTSYVCMVSFSSRIISRMTNMAPPLASSRPPPWFVASWSPVESSCVAASSSLEEWSLVAPWSRASWPRFRPASRWVGLRVVAPLLGVWSDVTGLPVL